LKGKGREGGMGKIQQRSREVGIETTRKKEKEVKRKRKRGRRKKGREQGRENMEAGRKEKN
jgi:hypothetical protein